MQSVTLRNFGGAFCGGIIGIFSAHLISPDFILLGVLLGVSIGWMNMDLLRLFSYNFWQNLRVADTIQKKYLTILRPLPIKLWRKYRIYIIRTLGFIALISIYGFSTPSEWFLEDKIVGGIITIIVFSGIITGVGVLAFSLPVNKSAERRLYYNHRRIIRNYSSVGLFFHQIYFHFYHGLWMTIYLLTVLIWLITLFIPIIIIATINTLIEAFDSAFHRFEFWLCLAVTMATTCLTWYYYQDSISNFLDLCLVALGTGIASGLITFGLGKVSPLISQLIPGLKKMSEFLSKLIEEKTGLIFKWYSSLFSTIARRPV